MDKMYDISKKKSKDLDPKFGVNIDKKLKPKTKPTVISRKKPSSKRKELTGKDAIKAYQREISPKGMAKTKADQTAALDKLMKKRYGKKK